MRGKKQTVVTIYMYQFESIVFIPSVKGQCADFRSVFFLPFFFKNYCC